MTPYRTNALPLVPRWGAARWVRFLLGVRRVVGGAPAMSWRTVALLGALTLATVLVHVFAGGWAATFIGIVSTWISFELWPKRPYPFGYMEYP